MLSRFLLVVLISLTVPVLSATVTVEVGDGGFTFTPNTATGQVGDTVVFDFSNAAGVSHSATQSIGLSSPCNQSPGGFNSGLKDSGTFMVSVTSTDPIYVYCMPHCATAGMVFILNPASPSDFQTFSSVAQGLEAPPSSSPATPNSTTPSAPPSASVAAPSPTAPGNSTVTASRPSATPTGAARGLLTNFAFAAFAAGIAFLASSSLS